MPDTSAPHHTGADLPQVLETIAESVEPLLGKGQVARYIPALAEVDPRQFAMAVQPVNGERVVCGQSEEPFSIQSVSKLFSLTCAMQAVGEMLWERVGREPSGDPFNSLVQLETEHGLPRNPLINAGALCVADQLVSSFDDPKAHLLQFVSELCGEPVTFDERVAASERDAGFRNAALANFMKSFSRVDNAVDDVLDLYFHQCSLRMNVQQLASAFAYLANRGVMPGSNKAIVSEQQARRINSLMLTCGTYDEAGEFAFRVGLPCKSGVGGAIVAVVPDVMTLCVWSPALGESGNSIAGFHALEMFTTLTGRSIF